MAFVAAEEVNQAPDCGSLGVCGFLWVVGLGMDFGAGDLLKGLSQSNLEASLGQRVEGLAAEMPVHEEGRHRLEQVTARHLALAVRLKGRAQDHQLINQMADLQALIVILGRPPADPGILVLEAIAVMRSNSLSIGSYRSAH